jgi:hypothetical protein
MKQYIGTKRVLARPMNRRDYNDYRGWALPENENGDDEGYLVEYMEGGVANHLLHAGYISWSPKDVFDGAYMEYEGMGFEGALAAMRTGMCAAREGWNGKGMWISIVAASMVPAGFRPYIEMKTADNQMVPWVASQTDLLANDWIVWE